MTRSLCILAFAGLSAFAASSWEKALIFYAPFDGSLDAKVAKGDPRFYSAPAIAFPPAGKQGLPENSYVTVEKGKGRFGDGLRFHRKTDAMIYFKAKDNFPYTLKGMEGTVSFWLKVSPDEELAPGYTDPVQITSKSWDNAAFFVEFSKDEKPREFRLGVYADFEVWNPDKRKWDDIPFREKPLLPVIRPAFSKDKWTHVLFTFKQFNTGEANGEAVLYLDGKNMGTMGPRKQTFTWDLDKALIMMGLGFIGGYDELAIFDRALSPAEVTELFSRDQPLK